MLTDEQRHILVTVTSAVSSNAGGLMFIDAPAGTGKTFLLNTVLAAIRSQGKIALATASSGIAATLLALGRTAHSRFKLPLNPMPDKPCNISAESADAEVLRRAHLIVWDEVSMVHRYSLEALDITLRDFCDSDTAFGGKPVLLAGDFRQILPVIRRGGRPETASACLTRSHLWSAATVMRLTRNMRVERSIHGATPSHAVRQMRTFSTWLLRLGDGGLPIVPNGGEFDIELPSELCTHTADELINHVYDGIQQQENFTNPFWWGDCALLTATNDNVDTMNGHIQALIPGDQVECVSVDEVGEDQKQVQFPPEFLNSLTPSGFPPHKFSIKMNMPVMLLRNMDAAGGHCNGTRYIVSGVYRRCLKLQVSIGKHAENEILLPRVNFYTSEGALPFTLVRRQFPIRPCFAMTVNKSQGQSLRRVGVVLQKPLFAHGQLYVAASRCGNPDGTRFHLGCTPGTAGPLRTTHNVVWPEVFQPRASSVFLPAAGHTANRDLASPDECEELMSIPSLLHHNPEESDDDLEDILV